MKWTSAAISLLPLFLSALANAFVIFFSGYGAARLAHRTGLHTYMCIAWLLVAAILTISGIVLLRDRRRASGKGRSLGDVVAFMGSSAIGLIYGFGQFYFLAGLVDSTNGTVISRSVSLYFSLVTWTTVGYGDFRPSAAVRAVAGLEAICGYVFMGFVVGLVLYWIGGPIARAFSGGETTEAN